MTSDATNEPSPNLIFDTLNGTYRIAALRAGVELELFTAIGQQSRSAEDLAKGIGASERGVRVLCDVLTVVGFLTKTGDQFALTPDSAAYLDKNSPLYFGGVIDLLGDPFEQKHLLDPAEVIRQGRTLISEEGTMESEHEWWIPFARLMAPMMQLPAEHIAETLAVKDAGPIKVLDIAAGHGVFGIEIAKRNPAAEIVAVDWAPVLQVAIENAEKAGVADRYHTISGSVFDADLGTGNDIVLMTNFLHHLDEPTCVELLARVRAGMNPGGCLATLEFVVNDDRISPATSAQFAMIMLSTTADGDVYTFTELANMAEEAGFSRSELVSLGRQEQRLVVSHVD